MSTLTQLGKDAYYLPGAVNEILVRVAELLDLRFDNLPQFYLMRTAVSAYLAYLVDQGRVRPWLDGQRLWWHQA
jgi:hypothetical protein